MTNKNFQKEINKLTPDEQAEVYSKLEPKIFILKKRIAKAKKEIIEAYGYMNNYKK